jgi:hypothetical protein
MKIKTSTYSLLTRTLIDSFSIQIMKDIISRFIQGYDFHQRTGIPENIPIQKTEAARQLVSDIKANNLFTRFVSLLVDIHYNGLTGRKYPVHNIGNLIREIQDYGYLYDKKNRMFVEDPKLRVSRNWGVLQEGEDYIFTFLRLDIVGNTKLVKKHPSHDIKSTYSDLHEIVKQTVIKRHGRIWSWEGDGGLIAFHFSNRNQKAMLSAMEIINRVFFYNCFECKLKQPVEIRVAVHTGTCEYTESEEIINDSETIKQIIEIESKYTEPNTVTISDTAWINLDPILADSMMPVDTGTRKNYYRYMLEWEK